MNKISLLLTASLLSGFAFAAPALAQSAPSMGTGAMGGMQPPQLQPKPGPDPTIPAAVPGAAGQGMQTQQNVAKPLTGDPTAQLFTAINANNYALAQDAISRGADLNAQNSLGETPIDLSVALNRNSITFMLLASRNDSGDGPSPVTAPVMATGPAPHHTAPGKSKTQALPAKLVGKPVTVNSTGTPNSSAGFLGFNH